MMKKSNSSNAVWLILFSLVINLIQSGCTPLHFDEAYYWVFSKNLDWGFFDHPPMAALSMALGGSISDHPAALRLLTVLMQPIWLLLFAYSIRQLSPNREPHRLNLLILLLFSLPIIHLTGFVATPDSPLMLFAFLFLYIYYQFDRLPTTGAILGLGITMAAMAYSKYHGALVVIFALIWNLKMLRNWRFYAASLLALALFIPHLLWQYEHDFASFTYHLFERSRDFTWEEVGAFALTLFFGFNPFLFPLFIRSFRHRHASNWEGLLRFVTVGFMLFCTVMSVRGHVQLQWLAVASFGYIASVYRVAMHDAKTSRYAMRVSVVTTLLFLLLRITLLFDTPLWKITGMGRDREDMILIHDQLKDTPLLITDTYFKTAAYQYYGGLAATFPPNMLKRGNQYKFYSDDWVYIGKTVALESYEGTHRISLGGDRMFRYDLIEDYLPTKQVRAAIQQRSTAETGDSLTIDVIWKNPYPHDISLSLQKGSQIRLLIGKSGEYKINKVITDRHETIPKRGTLKSSYTLSNQAIKPGDWLFICIERPPIPYSFAGRIEIK